jgi:hypothetical protein
MRVLRKRFFDDNTITTVHAGSPDQLVRQRRDPAIARDGFFRFFAGFMMLPRQLSAPHLQK